MGETDLLQPGQTVRLPNREDEDDVVGTTGNGRSRRLEPW